MADAEQTKVCSLCAETIKAAAKVCPHCRKSQRPWVFMTRYDFSAFVFALLLPVTLYSFCKIFYQERDFSLDRDKIRVTDFHFAVAKNQYGTNVVISGVLTNESEHSWDIGRLEIRYLNDAGKISDMDDYEYSYRFTVLPHNDHSFRVTLDRQAMPRYSVCNVKIVSANDPRARLNLLGY